MLVTMAMVPTMILNESLDSERHDECRQRMTRSAKKDKDKVAIRTQHLEDRWKELLQYEEDLKNKKKRMASKEAAKHSYGLRIFGSRLLGR